MPVVIDEVQVEAVEAQAPPHGGQPQGQRPGARPPLDANELAVILRRREQRLARLWAD